MKTDAEILEMFKAYHKAIIEFHEAAGQNPIGSRVVGKYREAKARAWDALFAINYITEYGLWCDAGCPDSLEGIRYNRPA